MLLKKFLFQKEIFVFHFRSGTKECREWEIECDDWKKNGAIELCEWDPGIKGVGQNSGQFDLDRSGTLVEFSKKC
jgi:hypothetical protein